MITPQPSALSNQKARGARPADPAGSFMEAGGAFTRAMLVVLVVLGLVLVLLSATMDPVVRSVTNRLADVPGQRTTSP